MVAHHRCPRILTISHTPQLTHPHHRQILLLLASIPHPAHQVILLAIRARAIHLHQAVVVALTLHLPTVVTRLQAATHTVLAHHPTHRRTRAATPKIIISKLRVPRQHFFSSY